MFCTIKFCHGVEVETYCVPFALVGAGGAANLVGLRPHHGGVVANHALAGFAASELANTSSSAHEVADL